MDTKRLYRALDAWQPHVLSILRIIVGLLFLQHGLQKWFGIPAPNPNYANIQLFTMVGIAGVIEIVFAALFTAGLFTRFSAFIMSGEMAVAHLFYTKRFARHYAPLINGGELEVMYCFVFFYFVFAGAGLWSVDALLRKTP
jgi:putative oxidoreductase